MKTWRNGGIILLILLAVGLLVIRYKRNGDQAGPIVPTSFNPATGAGLPNRNNPRKPEKAEIAKMFNERFKPAIERWCKAYSGRIPFKPEDVKAEDYNSMLGDKLYTFMVGSTTLTLLNNNDSAEVVYMMTRGAARAVNSIPSSGQTPDLSVPVTTDQVLQMVKADRGVDYPPSKVQITPSGEGTAIGGGATVTVNLTIINGALAVDGKNFSLIFDKNGTLVHYEGPME